MTTRAVGGVLGPQAAYVVAQDMARARHGGQAGPARGRSLRVAIFASAAAAERFASDWDTVSRPPFVNAALGPAECWTEKPTMRDAAALIGLRGGMAVVSASFGSIARACHAPDALKPVERLSASAEPQGGRGAFLDRLVEGGYSRAEYVARTGEMAVRGAVVDLWSSQTPLPWRIVFDADRVESIRPFDPDSQRSAAEPMATAEVLPVIPSSEMTQPATRGASPATATGTILDWLPKDAEIWCERPGLARLPEGWASRVSVWIEPLPTRKGVAFHCRGLPAFGGRFAAFLKQASAWTRQGFRTFVIVDSEAEASRLTTLAEEEADAALGAGHPPPSFTPIVGSLGAGFLDLDARRAVVTADQIFMRPRAAARRARRADLKVGPYGGVEFVDLVEGEYVVHERAGIALYRGLVTMHDADLLVLEFSGHDRLYVPLADFSLVQKYLGPTGAKPPRLSTLDTAGWERVKSRVRKRVEEIARDLLRVAAARAARARPAYPSDSVYEHEFAAAFPFDETPDQARAIADVLADLAAPKPMDRLVCGDVGYGKTEVALRAAFKAVLAGKQAAVLVPTTLLAEQHFQTFRARLADQPVVVEMLSRFRGPREQASTLKRLAAGEADIVIGTHRLLQKDVAFRDLGLVIVDEEHRFGVKDKERLKSLRLLVDVLALTATPIPRTLAMAVGGVRDMSVIESPPAGRLPVETFVGAHDDTLIQEALRAELRRGGQAFVVHNRVRTIAQRLQALRHLVPEARFGLAHGAMRAAALEQALLKFIRKETDVLVATAIVESGLDIPNANTLIVEEADEFGLAQLYQLRGRVGRERQKAYAYLFAGRSGGLTEAGRQRLQALTEFAELGSGFRLAVRDLEMRGAGNLLGPEQHGYVRDVGLDLYSALLAREVAKQKGEPVEEEAPPRLDLAAAARLPEDYVPDLATRLIFYKRLVGAPDEAALAGVADELRDRFGPWPDPVETLLDVVRLRRAAMRARASAVRSVLRTTSRVTQEVLSVVGSGTAAPAVRIEFRPDTPVTSERLLAAGRESGLGVRFLPGGKFEAEVWPIPPGRPGVARLTTLLAGVMRG